MPEPIESVISPWMPITEPHKIAALAKAIEEQAELIGALSRCLMAGFDEFDPKSKLPNIEEVNKEYTDAKATMRYLARVEPRLQSYPDRAEGKIRGFERWHRMIDERLAAEQSDEAAAAFVEGNHGSSEASSS